MLADAILSLPYPRPPSYLTSWKPGVTPLSTISSVTAAITVYLGTVFGLWALQKNSQPKKLNTLFQIHNIVLSSVSGLLLVLILEEIVPIIYRHGVFYGFCGAGAWTEVRFLRIGHNPGCSHLSRESQRLEFYYLMNYFCKYLELLDTVFLALKKKPLSASSPIIHSPYRMAKGYRPAFLHVFHHAATAALCYTQLDGKTSVVSYVLLLPSLNLTFIAAMGRHLFESGSSRPDV
jgi:fatty acid elongase 3